VIHKTKMIKLAVTAGFVSLLAMSGIACGNQSDAGPGQTSRDGMSNAAPNLAVAQVQTYIGTVGGPPSVSEDASTSGKEKLFWNNMTGLLLAKYHQQWCAANRQAVKDQIQWDEVNAPYTLIEGVVPQMIQAGQLNHCGIQSPPAPQADSNVPSPSSSEYTPSPTPSTCYAQPSQASSTGYTYKAGLVRGPGCDTKTGQEIDNACQYDNGWTCPPGIVPDPYGNYMTAPSPTPSPAPAPPPALPPAPCVEANGSTGYSC
jgi:hypothetical protein